MKLIKLSLILLTALLMSSEIILADSPLTSTPFHDKYTDVDIVLKAEQMGTMNKEFADFLHDKSNSIDEKAALINALGWNTEGKSNAVIYNKLIHGKDISGSDISSLNSNELFVIGYLMAMDNYLDVSKALPFIKQARVKNKTSYTVAMIEALVKAQSAMENDFCKVWKLSNKVFSNEDLEKDMRESATKIIYDYMIIYKEYCK